MHGFVSGKGRGATSATQDDAGTTGEQKVALRNRLAAIERARGSVARVEKEEVRHQQRRPFWRRGNGKDRDIYADGAAFVHNRQAWEQDKLRRQRLAEIDQLQESYGQTLAELANEKELLLNIPNPLWNYTTSEELEEELDRASEEEQRRRGRLQQAGDVPSTNETTAEGASEEDQASE